MDKSHTWRDRFAESRQHPITAEQVSSAPLLDFIVIDPKWPLHMYSTAGSLQSRWAREPNQTRLTIAGLHIDSFKRRGTNGDLLGINVYVGNCRRKFTIQFKQSF